MSGPATEANLVWMDLEMTGLDPEWDRIIEIATVITDSDLNVVVEAPPIVVKQSDALLAGMDEWNTTHHGESGLIDQVRASEVTERMAEERTLKFLMDHIKASDSPLCGNSIGQDRRFLVRYMPRVESFLHNRNLDISTIKELAARWRPEVHQAVTKNGVHRALDDVYESIDELRHYRATFFRVD